MGDTAIRVENLGKMYRIGGPQEKYSTLRDTITNAVTAPINKVRGLLCGESASGLKEEVWALKDVSFEVKHGEVVGIIGRNGAGKSTLLKILSRITEPTTGYADIYGRVGALLEVGTGFHPELTGRENVYLNGAILGMSWNDIERKFDEIVDFAGVEKFIDTPVKHYSSGMGLRLGFAVAAHLEPEVLVVDEVLAVGDAEFQKKCLGKMSAVAEQGRTVLFVSHNMAAVKSLCTRCIFLNAGVVHMTGEVNHIIHQYQTSFNSRETISRPSEIVYFSNPRFNGHSHTAVDARLPFTINIDFYSKIAVSSYFLYCIARDIDNNTILHARVGELELGPISALSQNKVQISFPAIFLRPGVYSLEFKFIANDQVKTPTRFISEPILLEIVGNSDPSALIATLTPSPTWSILSSNTFIGLI